MKHQIHANINEHFHSAYLVAIQKNVKHVKITLNWMVIIVNVALGTYLIALVSPENSALLIEKHARKMETLTARNVRAGTQCQQVQIYALTSVRLDTFQMR